MGAFPSSSAPSGYSQEISLKKKSLALLQSSRAGSSLATSPQPQPYPETYTISSSPASPATTRNTPTFAESPNMSDSQCTSDSPQTSDSGSTPGASDGDSTIKSPTQEPSSPSQSCENEPPAQELLAKSGRKRAAPSP